MMTFREVPVHNTGLVLILLSNGTLMLERSHYFTPFIDMSDGKVVGSFFAEAFSLVDADGGTSEYDYGTAYPYKEMPVLKKWLVEQNLEM